jgi:hypothetical protein
MAVGAVVARILTQYSDKGSKAAQRDIKKLGKNIDAFGKKATRSFAIAGVAAAAFAVKLGVDATKAAIEDSKSQAMLANNLRNVTGATDETIKSVEDYISKQQILANVSDTELRASFSQLVVATRDVTTAMDLQSVALDTAAGSGKDLGTVSAAIAKATAGNFTALKRLIPTLDANIVKNKDLAKAIAFLSRTYEGSAKKLGDTDPLKKLQLAYGEVLETLGFAILPVIIPFVEYIRTEVLPGIESWIALNKDELTASLQVAADEAKKLLIVAGKVALWAKDNVGLIKAVGAAIATMFVVGKVSAFISILNVLITTYKALAASAGIAAVAAAFATGGLNLVAGAAAIAGYAFLVTKLREINIEANKAEEAQKNLVKTTTEGVASEVAAAKVAARAQTAKNELNKKQAEIAAMIAAQNKKNAAAQAALDAKAAAAAKRKADIEAKTAAVKKRIEATTGLKITNADEYELIQLTAVEKLQKKQKDADDSLAERIKLRKEELALFNSLTAKTAQYLDFLKAINSDGKLDDSEIAKLISKWNLTQVEAQKYADFVYAIGDRKLSDKEIENLKSKWGLTTQQVVDYINKIGAPVDAKGTVLSAGDIAALGWKNAASALDEYNAKLKSAGITPTPPSPPTMNPPIPNPVQDLIDREMAIDKPFMPGDFGYLGIPKTPAVKSPAPLTSSLYGGGIDYSKIFRSSTLDNGMSLMSDQMSNSGGTTNINLTVNGSVTSEQDLVQTIRQGLLQGQSSGYSLVLETI